jgi:SAM-dependent methyltransferase
LPEHAATPVSPWFTTHRALLVEASRRGPVLDLACGRGRHALAAAGLGATTLAIDRDAEALASLDRAARARQLPLQALRADLETPRGIPVRPGSCGAILVFCFLFRPLATAIVEALAPGGLLLYETFTLGQRALGRGPRRAEFLLAEGELPQLFAALEPIAVREGPTGGDSPACLASFAGRRR